MTTPCAVGPQSPLEAPRRQEGKPEALPKQMLKRRIETLDGPSFKNHGKLIASQLVLHSHA